MVRVADSGSSGWRNLSEINVLNIRPSCPQMLEVEKKKNEYSVSEIL